VREPLLLYDDTLLAQAEGKGGKLSLAGLRTKDLEPAFTVDVPLPGGVQASVSDRLGASFYACALMDSDVILMQWRSVSLTVASCAWSFRRRRSPALLLGEAAGAQPTVG
jgi:hypothetical protein